MKRSSVYYSESSDAETAFEEVCSKIEKEGEKPKLIVFFSELEIFRYCAENMKRRFPDVLTIGSTSYFNFSTKGMGKTGLAVMTVNSGIECSAGLIFEIDRYPMNYVSNIKNALAGLSGTDNTCCLEFATGFSQGEELILDTFSSVLKNTGITVFGGSAGSDSVDNITLVSLDGIVYKNTCAFVFIRNLEGRIAYVIENIFKPTGHYFSATDVDCEERIVYEFDNQPATEFMSGILGATGKELEDMMVNHPLGRLVNDNIFITQSVKMNDDDSITYFSRVFNMTRIVLLEQDDFDKVWADTLERARKLIPRPAFTFAINCFCRAQLFEREGRSADFNDELRTGYGNFLCLSGYGEQIGNMHLNQSMVLLMFE